MFYQSKKRLMKYLNKNQVETAIHYPLPVYKQEAFVDSYKQGDDFKKTDKLTKEILSIPVNPWLKEEEVGLIIELINNFSHEQ